MIFSLQNLAGWVKLNYVIELFFFEKKINSIT